MNNVNLILLAGTKGAQKFNINGKEEYKQFLEIEGRKVIEYSISAALEAKNVKNVYIVGDSKRIKRIIEEKYSKHIKRIAIVEQKKGLIENVLNVFLNHILPDEGFEKASINNIEEYRKRNPKAAEQRVMLMTSDVPLISSKDIDEFIETNPKEYDYAMGLTRAKVFEEMIAKTGLVIDNLEEVKLGFFPIYKEEVRVNNFHMLKPLKLDIDLLNLAQIVFDNRKLLKVNGKEDFRTWLRILYSFVKYIGIHNLRFRVWLGLLLGVFYGSFFYLAHKTRKWKITKIPAHFVKPDKIEKCMYYITNGAVKCRLHISNNLSSFFDIDIQNTYTMLTKENNAIYKKIHNYTH